MRLHLGRLESYVVGGPHALGVRVLCRGDAVQASPRLERSPMAGDLEDVEELVAAELCDSAHDVWSTDELDQHIRHALQRVSQAVPVVASVVLDTEADVYEYPLLVAEVESPVYQLPPYYYRVVDVCYPWDEAQPVYPPPRPDGWELISTDNLLIRSSHRPTGEDDCQMRVFYTTGYPIADLDDADDSTLSAEGETLVVFGASAFAALQRAQDAVTRVYAVANTPAELRDWSEARLQQFEAQLALLRQGRNLAGDARVKLG
ncbi:MAG: hypothetical protein ACYCZF_03755 [Anaerolineae bacterium]